MLANTLAKELPQTNREGHSLSSPQAEHTHDLELARRIAARDESALRELYATYGQRLYAYALRLVGVPATAEDVVQDTLVAAWQSAARFRGEGRLLAWLLGIVHHTAMKALRHTTRPISEALEATLPNPASSPEECFQAEQRAQWVRQGLQSLSPEHRAVLELVFYQGLSLNEVAQVCSCPVGTVKSRLSYARKQLRGILSRQEEA
jgi:RNA polymerase sigma-70 factor (ECF subfamily)